jgi:hypothetical protein
VSSAAIGVFVFLFLLKAGAAKKRDDGARVLTQSIGTASPPLGGFSFLA